jgi:hypothetical protein
MAAYRFVPHSALGVQAMRAGPTPATLERLRTPARVVLGPAPTVLHDGTPHPQAGVGPVKPTPRAASLRPPPGVLTPARGNGGVVGLQVWPRPAPPVAQPRHRTPSEDHARSHWLEGDQGACKVHQACPATLGVTRAERAGDSQEGWVAAMAREPGQRAAGMRRATWQRRLGPGAAAALLGTTHPRPRSSASAAVSPGTRSGTAKPVPCPGARRLGGHLPPGTAPRSCTATVRLIRGVLSKPVCVRQMLLSAGLRLRGYRFTQLPMMVC